MIPEFVFADVTWRPVAKVKEEVQEEVQETIPMEVPFGEPRFNEDKTKGRNLFQASLINKS